ncbi:hypothetical protein [Streptomyces sp. NPDC101166]|uniref:hypothetical protein n=1 Tax=Streptomyces sp. NPDC101166 TaxID=3366120 RepID=UPI0037FC3254
MSAIGTDVGGKKMKLHKKVLGVGMATVALSIPLMGTAFAGQDALSSTHGASAHFINVGDKFEVCDLAFDGNTAKVEYEYVRKDGTLQKGSHSATVDSGNCSMFDHDFGEGRKVKFRAVVQIPFWPDVTGPWKTGIA